MKVMNREEMKKLTIDGKKGAVDIWDAVSEPGVVAGVRVVHPRSTVPGEGHLHMERQLNYLISGRCEVYTTDGSKTTLLRPGDFLWLDTKEPHFFTAFEEPAVLFEVRYP